MEFIFPKNIYCINCDEPISRLNTYSLCNKCYNNIKTLYNVNTDYDKEIKNILDSEYVQEIHIFSIYEKTMKNLIHKIKYSNKTYIAKYFSDMLLRLINYKNIDFDYISSMPIHSKRLMQRGYNQVDLIVKHMAVNTNKEIVNISKRVKETKDMYTLDLKSRSKEMKDAFESEHIEKLSKKTLLIVDDILTTGSTALNLSKSIKEKNENLCIKMIFLARASLK